MFSLETALCKQYFFFAILFSPLALVQRLAFVLYVLFVGNSSLLVPDTPALANVHFLSHRLPTLLFRDAAGNLPEGHELEGDSGLPARGAHLGESQGPDPEVGLPSTPVPCQLSQLSQLFHWVITKWHPSNTLSELSTHVSVAGTAPMPRIGLEPGAWRRLRATRSLRRSTGSTSGVVNGGGGGLAT